MNLARLDLVSMQLVVFCAESGSLSRAAHRAFVSVTGASYKLRCLEEAFGQKIFERSPRGLTPTQSGSAIIDGCREMIELADHLVDLARPQQLQSLDSKRQTPTHRNFHEAST
jgi:DNA-binding transcriptional LysR family regulator